MVRQMLRGIVAKNENSTEHSVNLHSDYLTPWGPKTELGWFFFKYVDLSSITLKISLLFPEP